MSIVYNDNIKLNAPKSLDTRYLATSGMVPYTDVNAVNAAILSAYRHLGLTVLINNQEYWYRDGITDGNLVVKNAGTVSSFGFTDGNGFDGTVTNSTSTPTLSLTTSLTSGSVPFIGSGGTLNDNNSNLNWNDSTTTLTVDNTLRTDIINALPGGNGYITLRTDGSSPTSEVFVSDDGLGVGIFAGGVHTARIKAAGNIESNDAFVLDSGATIGELYISGSDVGLRTTTNHNLLFSTNDVLRFRISNTGELQASSYPNTRNDGTTTKALYTDASGNILLGDIDGGSSAWLLSGNSGTNPSSNFLGTVDNQPLVFRTNGAEQFRITETGVLQSPNFGVAGITPLVTDPTGSVSAYPSAINGSSLKWDDSSSSATWTFGIRSINVTSSGGITLWQGDEDVLVTIDASSGNISYDIVATSDGQVLTIKKIDSTTNVVFVIPTSSSIDGELQYVLFNQNDSVTLQWSGNTSSWHVLSPAYKSWSLLGNVATDATVNFLGTRDVQPLVFRTTNIERARISPTGSLGIGNTNPNVPLHVGNLNSVGTLYNAKFEGLNSGVLINSSTALGGLSGGVLELSSFLAPTAIDQRFGLISFTSRTASTAGTGVLVEAFSNGAWTLPSTAPSYLDFKLNNGLGLNSVLRLYDNHINTSISLIVGDGMSTVPSQTLHVSGTARITGSDGTATTLMGRDSDGDISAITVGSGLSLAGNTLTATGGGGGVSSFSFTDGNGFDGTVTTPTSTPTLSLTTSLTTGSIPFIASGGALSQNNSQFFWDNTNIRLGIGTTTPSVKLHVIGTTSENIVGVFERTVTATNTITSPLVARTTTTGDMANSFGTSIVFQIKDNAGVDNSVGVISAVRNGADNTGDVVISPTTAGVANERMRIMSSGNVGIGITAPITLLDVRSTTTLQANFQNTAAFSASSGAFSRYINSGTPTAADQRMGGTIWGSNPSGGTQRTGASIVGYSEGAWTDNVSHPTYLQFNTTASGSITNTERMRISASGNVTIGTLAGTGIRVTTSTATGQLGAIPNGVDGQVLTLVSGSPAWANAGGSGTVTSFSAGNLTPLFTTNVTTATTTPTLSFVLSNAAANTVLGNNTGSAAAPVYFSPVLASSLFANQGTATQVLHGNASGNPSWGAVNLAADVSGNLPVTHLNSGTGASATTFWRGDGTWAVPPGGGGGVTTIGTINSQTKSANGAVITGTDLILQTADSTFPGVVSITTQTFAGDKVFEGNVYIDTTHINREKLLIDGDVTGATDMNGISGATALSIAGYTYTDTGAARTVSTLQHRSNFIAPVISATNAVIYTDVATISISPPVESGNMTITRPRSINAGGISHLDVVANDVFESSGSVFIGDAGHNIFTGTTATWFLRSLVESRGAILFIKNAGSGNLTIDADGSDQIYDTSAAGTLVIAAGTSRILVAGTSFWYAE